MEVDIVEGELKYTCLDCDISLQFKEECRDLVKDKILNCPVCGWRMEEILLEAKTGK
jgi:DNA-directed RNA polymerase subunit RPC12/RpoP